METKVYFTDSLEREVMAAKSSNSVPSFSSEREDSLRCIGFNAELCCGSGKKNMTTAVHGLYGNSDTAGGEKHERRKTLKRRKQLRVEENKRKGDSER